MLTATGVVNIFAFPQEILDNIYRHVFSHTYYVPSAGYVDCYNRGHRDGHYRDATCGWKEGRVVNIGLPVPLREMLHFDQPIDCQQCVSPPNGPMARNNALLLVSRQVRKDAQRALYWYSTFYFSANGGKGFSSPPTLWVGNMIQNVVINLENGGNGIWPCSFLTERMKRRESVETQCEIIFRAFSGKWIPRKSFRLIIDPFFNWYDGPEHSDILEILSDLTGFAKLIIEINGYTCETINPMAGKEYADVRGNNLKLELIDTLGYSLGPVHTYVTETSDCLEYRPRAYRERRAAKIRAAVCR